MFAACSTEIYLSVTDKLNYRSENRKSYSIIVSWWTSRYVNHCNRVLECFTSNLSWQDDICYLLKKTPEDCTPAKSQIKNSRMTASWLGFYLMGLGFLFRHGACTCVWRYDGAPFTQEAKTVRRTWPAGRFLILSKSLFLGRCSSDTLGKRCLHVQRVETQGRQRSSRAKELGHVSWSRQAACPGVLFAVHGKLRLLKHFFPDFSSGKMGALCNPESPGKISWENAALRGSWNYRNSAGSFGNKIQQRRSSSEAVLWKIHGWNSLDRNFPLI